MGRRRTRGVGKLVLLALYSVLEGLRIAAGDLDLLLDRLLVHVGHGVTAATARGEVVKEQIQRARCGTVRYGTARYSTVRYGAVVCSRSRGAQGDDAEARAKAAGGG